VERRNITLSLPRDLLISARHLAVEKGVSLSGMLADLLREMIDHEQACQRAVERIERRLTRGFDLGTGGKVTWTRGELHER
jgi:uncharacterized protein YoaH (UPF0181 family)